METNQFNERVNDRLESLLARCDRIRRGTAITRPTRFDEQGQRHAEQVAARDANNAAASVVCDVSMDAKTAGHKRISAS